MRSRMRIRRRLLGTALALVLPNASTAAEKPETPSSEEIIVTAEMFVRSRTDDVNPVLVYDRAYFERFEPVSVGEMLKRVSGVTFSSDILEYEGVEMRGLPPGFTQILINGRRAPGGDADRSFFVDRIPAELVERIEIVRAPSADQPSEGVAGTLNIITRDSAAFRGGFAKLGALVNGPDGKIRPSAAVAYAGTMGRASLWGALNYQGRRNPKTKVSDFFDGEFGAFTGRELQDDARDGADLSANAELSAPVGEGRLRLTGLFIDTDRDEDETDLLFLGSDIASLALEIAVTERERIGQQTYALVADASIPFQGGELELAGGWTGYREDSLLEIGAGDTIPEVARAERETLDITDDEFSGTVAARFGPKNLSLKVGADVLHKLRDGANREFEIDDGVEEETTRQGAIFAIEETRIDPYVQLIAEPISGLSIDAGLRYEVTRRDVRSDGGHASFDDATLNPSLHVRYVACASGTFRASLARTVRRPDYNFISPYRQEEEPADDDELIGNPALANETAWGVDVGYERQLDRSGIIGVNLFFRDITDVIELVDTGAVADAGGSVFEPRNVGDGRAWGVEIDISTSLSALGLPDTGVFANYTYLDSEIADPLTGVKRRFSRQPHHVYNFGFVQNLRQAGISFGASLSGRSSALDSLIAETELLRYGQDLEAFLEKRLGQKLVIRFTAANILDRSKREDFRFYDGASVAELRDARLSNDVASSERGRESGGALFQLTMRAAF